MLKKIQWLSVAQVLFAFALVIAPLAFSANVADAGFRDQGGLCGELGGQINCNQGGDSVRTWIIRIINIILALTLAVDVLFLIIGGFLYITSAGNEERAKKGRTTVINAVIGLVIIILAYLISTFVANFFSNVSPTNNNI